MAEDKIYISRMLNDVIGNVGDMSVSMTQLAEAMKEMKTEISNSVTELQSITQNTAAALTEIAITAGKKADTPKATFPKITANTVSGSGEYQKISFVSAKIRLKSFAYGTLALVTGPMIASALNDIDSDGDTAGVDKYDKSWRIHLGAKIKDKMYYSSNSVVGDAPNGLIMEIPVKKNDVIEIGMAVELLTADASAKPIGFKFPKNWFKIIYNQTHIEEENAIIEVTGIQGEENV